MRKEHYYCCCEELGLSDSEMLDASFNWPFDFVDVSSIHMHNSDEHWSLVAIKGNQRYYYRFLNFIILINR